MIIRTYMCDQCAHTTEVTLRADQWDSPPPACEICAQRTHQEFKPPALIGSIGARARDLALDIAHNDYGVADLQVDGKEGETPKFRLKDQGAPTQAATWGVAQEALESAIAAGRQNRLQFGGDGLDVLKRQLKTGDQPDLIEISKRRSMRVW